MAHKYPHTKVYYPAGTLGSIAALRYYQRIGKHLGDWYAAAHKFCQEIADMTGIPIEVVAGVVAILSPGIRWDTNMQAAAKLILAWRNRLTDEDPIPAVAAIHRRNREKAWQLLSSHNCDLVSGPKVRPFWQAILGDADGVPVDRIMARAYTHDPRSGSRGFTKSFRQDCERDIALLANYLGQSKAQTQYEIWQGYKEKHGV